MTPLHQIGQLIRDILIVIPLSMVRVLVVVALVGLLVWVLRLPKTDTQPVGGAKRWDENLKIGAGIALAIQIAIYSLL